MKKTSFISYICLLLAVLMVVSLAGCSEDPVLPSGGDQSNGGDSSNTDDFENEDNPDNSGNGGGNENDNPTEDIPTFTLENLKNAKIVYNKKLYAPEGLVVTALDGLITAIKNQFSVTLERTSDQVVSNHDTYKELEYEIVVGETKREESSEALTDLLQGDWGYKIQGTKIVIKGGSQEALLAAINDFRTNVVVNRHGAKEFYNGTLDKIKRENRVGKDLTINGTPISEFTIIYPNKSNEFEKELARRLSDHIAMLSGHILPFYPDGWAKSEHEILIGETKREFAKLTTSGAAVEADANNIAIVGANAYDYGLAQELLSDLIEAAAIAKKPLTLPAQTTTSATEKVKMMSYNVYGFHAYTKRCDNLCRLITKYLPDIVGYQEPDVAMTDKLRMYGYYEWFDGKPRHTLPDGSLVADKSGANSISPIGYAKDRYEFILGDTKWCTATPDYPSKNPVASHYRMYTYVMLRDKVTGEEFIVVNHHLQGAIASEQLTYMFKFFQANYTDIPVIMLGDYNSEWGTDAIARVMIKDGGFTSLHSMANNPESNAPARIDWIFAMSCCVRGTYYKWCKETYPDAQAIAGERFGDGLPPSDHMPVYAELIIKADRSEHTHDWSKLASEVEFETQPTVPERVN